MEDLDQLAERARPARSTKEYEQLKAAVDTPAYLTQLVEDKDTTIQRLRQILFGVSTEKTDRVLNNEVDSQESWAERDSADALLADRTPEKNQASARRSPGHGRNRVQAYGGADTSQVSHGWARRAIAARGTRKASCMSREHREWWCGSRGRRRWRGGGPVHEPHSHLRTTLC